MLSVTKCGDCYDWFDFSLNKIRYGGFSVEFKTKAKAHLCNVTIYAEHQNKGFGTQMIKECLEHLRSLGVKKVTLDAWKGNLPAIRCYEKNGFKIVSKDYYVGMEVSLQQNQTISQP